MEIALLKVGVGPRRTPSCSRSRPSMTAASSTADTDPEDEDEENDADEDGDQDLHGLVRHLVATAVAAIDQAGRVVVADHKVAGLALSPQLVVHRALISAKKKRP